jgi:thiamine-phosphate diphosphorylase
MPHSRGLGDRPLICLVTNRHRLAALLGAHPDSATTFDALAALVEHYARAGGTLVHLREADLVDDALFRLTDRLSAIADTHGARLVVNDRLDIALAAPAHGVHLKESSFPAVRVRGVAPPGFVIGRSVHDLQTCEAMAREGAVDYVVFGPIYASRSKPGAAPAGPAALRAVTRAISVPVVAIGGVSEGAAAEIATTGAAGIAGIDLFIRAFASQSVQRVVEDLRRAFDSAEMVP